MKRKFVSNQTTEHEEEMDTTEEQQSDLECIDEYLDNQYKDLQIVDLLMKIRNRVQDPLELIRKVEHEYNDQCDTELGDFLNTVCENMIFCTEDTVEYAMYTAVLNSELNLDMLLCVAKQIFDIQTTCMMSDFTY